jgi:hypothetical protein
MRVRNSPSPSLARSPLFAGSLLLLSACGGQRTSRLLDASPLSDARGDSAITDALRSVTEDGPALAVPEASPPSDVFTVSSPDAGAYPSPPLDAATFDGCASTRCEAGIVCVDTNTFGTLNKATCYPPPTACGDATTCLCLVQAATWCWHPTCTEDGGLTMTCSPPAPP